MGRDKGRCSGCLFYSPIPKFLSSGAANPLNLCQGKLPPERESNTGSPKSRVITTQLQRFVGNRYQKLTYRRCCFNHCRCNGRLRRIPASNIFLGLPKRLVSLSLNRGIFSGICTRTEVTNVPNHYEGVT